MNSLQNHHLRSIVGSAAIAAVCTLSVAACGSSHKVSSTTSGSGSSGTSQSSTSVDAAPTSYDGPAARLPNAYPVPKRTGAAIKVGYIQVSSSQEDLVQEQQGAAQRAKQLGVQLIVKDCELSPQTEVAQFQQLLEQGVKSILLLPLVPTSLGPELAAAKKAGVSVIAQSALPDVTQKLLPGYTTDVEGPNDHETFSMAQYGARIQPHAQIGVIGTALPIAVLKYIANREEYWARHFGLQVDGEADAAQDTPSSYGTAIDQLLSDHPGLQQIWTYNELQAETAATVVRSSGRHLKIVTANFAGDPTAIKSIKSGAVSMGYQDHYVDLGAQQLNAAYDEATHQHLPLAKLIVVPGTVVTQANAASDGPR
jgi:ribose transport system substrate-binding protein